MLVITGVLLSAMGFWGIFMHLSESLNIFYLISIVILSFGMTLIVMGLFFSEKEGLNVK